LNSIASSRSGQAIPTWQPLDSLSLVLFETARPDAEHETLKLLVQYCVHAAAPNC
jgi:hypothetical protein